jgi:hypothetical protein
VEATFRRVLPYAAFLVFLAGAAYRFDPKLSMNGDDAEFLILGRSLAAGEGMTNINEPHPTAHTKYPFLFPALLALLQTAAPGSILVPKIAVVLLGACAAYLFARLLLRVASPGVALFGSALYVANPFFLDFSQQILSETPYLFVSLLALVLFLRWEEKGGWGLFGGACAATLASYFTRTAGIALVGAMLALLLSRRRAREGLILGLAFLLAAGSWALRNRSAGGGNAYVTQFLAKNPYDPGAGSISLGAFLTERVPANLATYGTYEVGRGILPRPFLGAGARDSKGLQGLGLALAAVAVCGIVLRARGGTGVLELYTLFSLAVCLAWPEVWGSIRFLLPVLPLLLYYFLSCGGRALGRLPAGGARGAAAAAAGIVLLFSSADANRREKPTSAYPPAWRNYEACAAWARANTPGESVFAVRKPGLFYVWSGRRSVAYLWSDDREAVFRKLEADGVDYVVIAALSATTPRYLVPAVNEHRERFEVVHTLPNPDTYVLRLRPEGER